MLCPSMFVDRGDMLNRVDIVYIVDQLQTVYKCLKGFKIILKKSFMFYIFLEGDKYCQKVHYFLKVRTLKQASKCSRFFLGGGASS